MRFILLLPFVHFVAGGSETSEGGKKSDVLKFSDLTEFLNTTRRIWVHLQTYSPGDHKCVNQKLENFEEKKYIFIEGYGQYEQKKKNLIATLSKNSGENPKMVVIGKEDGETTTYVLKYHNVNERCAIFSLPEKGEDACELRLWDEENMDRERRDCENAYDEYCVGKRKVFDANCEYIRHQVNSEHA